MSRNPTAGADRIRRLVLHVAATLVLAAGLAAPASAQNLEDALVLFGKKDGAPYIYGHVNKGVLVYDDGDATEVYPLVDNNNSSTRAGVKFHQDIAQDLEIFFNLEGEWKPYSTGRVNRTNKNDVDWDAHALRKLEFRLGGATWGRVWVGQGSMASDASAEQDLSGTGVIAYSSVGDSAGGQLIALSDGTLSGIRIGGAFGNLDGLSRRNRIRYDTPSFEGLRLSTSGGYNALGGDDDFEWDIGGSYGLKSDAYQMKSALFYSRPKGDGNRVSGSVSVFHEASRVSLTLAGGYDDGSDRDPNFVYGKLGYSPVLTDLGRTSFAIDGYLGNDFASAGSDSFSIGIAAVQAIGFAHTGLDLYATLRWYDYDDPSASFDTGLGFLTGIRFRF